MNRITPDNITKLEPNQIFVFGSNLSGIHGKGAAKLAQDKFKAKRGVGYGPTGQCYAIPTRGVWRPATKEKFTAIEIEDIGEHVWDFLTYAKQHPELEFLVTKIGCGNAGFQEHEMAKLFSLFGPIPDNVSLPKEFWSWLIS